MMDRFISRISNIATINKSEAEQIRSCLYTENFKANEFIHKKGTKKYRYGFILDGIIRYLNDDDSGNEVTTCFYFRNQCFSVITPPNGLPFDYSVQAVTDSSILFIDTDNDEKLSYELIKWSIIARRLTEISLHEKNRQITILVHTDAATKYKEFLKNYGEFAHQIPLGYLASYLGIRQQSLSRIRKNINL